MALAPRGGPALLANGLPRWTLPLAIAGASLATMGLAHRFDGGAKGPPALVVIADSPTESIAPGFRTATSFRSIPEVPAAEVRVAGERPPDHHIVFPLRRPVPSRDELMLLQRARAAVATGAWNDAHSVVSEHARRFPAGQLVEEREALRVKALMGLGRADEARDAARAFEARFPRSVLGPVVASASDAPL